MVGDVIALTDGGGLIMCAIGRFAPAADYCSSGEGPYFIGFFGVWGVPITLFLAAFKMHFNEECLAQTFGLNENST
jgi:hypothetical protein